MENEILTEKSAQILRLDSQNARFKKENGFQSGDNDECQRRTGNRPCNNGLLLQHYQP